MGLLRFSQRTALITGAGRGIGAATAVRLASEGCCVAVNDIDEALCRRTADSIRAAGAAAVAVPGDVCSSQAAMELVDQTIAQFGRLDILVNNAGIVRDGTLLKLSEEKFDQVIQVNLRGPFLCSHFAAKHMKAQGYGRIINLSSISGAAGNFGQCNYAASKAGLIGFTKTAALELARYGITVNCVAPGFVTSEMTRTIPEEIRLQKIQAIPAGRGGTPEEIAGAIAYLASEEAGFVNGITLHINGGSYMA